MRNSKRLGFLAALVASSLLLMAGASSADARQAWRLDAYSNTTVAPGGSIEYATQATNVGDVSMNGTTIRWFVRLPDHMTVVSADILNISPLGISGCADARDGVSTPVGASSIVCTNTHAVPRAQIQRLRLTTTVDGSASGTLVPEFEISGGGAATVRTVDPIVVSSSPPGFGVADFDGQVFGDAAGTAFTQAGGHPYSASVSLDLNTVTSPDPLLGQLWPAGPLKDVFVDLPPGLVGDPTVPDRCTLGELATMGGQFVVRSLCPATSQVGTVLVRLRGPRIGNSLLGPLPVFSLEPPSNVPARFGFNIIGTIVTLDAELRSGGDYGLTVNARNLPQALGISGTDFTFWGVPSSPSHDLERACPGEGQPWSGGRTCASGAPLKPFLRNPTSCTAPGVGVPTTARVDAWDNPGVFESATFISHLPPAYPTPLDERGAQVGPTGCSRVPFNPSFTARPAVAGQAGKPAGFTFDLTLPQTDDPNIVGTGDLKKAVVTLPLGVRVSPSSADGLGACAPAQIRLDDGSVPTCPESSKVGSVTIETPLLDESLSGSVYLARQRDNPFGSLLSVYLVAEGPGLVVKLPGLVTSHPISGQLTATFDDNPQLPFSNLHLEFKSGPRAPLTLPNTCGEHTTHYAFTSWSGRRIERDTSFTVDQGCEPRGFSPKLSGGLQNPIAGSQSPFVLRLTREDTDQEFSSLDVVTPPGLTAVLKGVPYCPQASIDVAKTMKALGQGALELANPACPAASQVGTVQVGVGAGTNPFYVNTGKAYLAGPYKGAPLSLAIGVPAVAGPFDLGNVFVQSAIHVDPSDAHLTVRSDPLPTMLHGIPLDERDIRVNMDRPNFTLGPTSCDPMSIDATVRSTQGMTANPSERFQMGNCANLGFKPKLNLRLFGGTNRTDYPRFRATLKARPGDANIDRVSVALPRSVFLANEHIRTVCTRAQFAASECPRGSIYGYARAFSPLLDEPLQGPVYLKSSNNKLPDLVAALDGQVHLDLVGRIDAVQLPGGNTGIRNTFDVVPDAPVDRFVLTMMGGRQGLLVNSANLCAQTYRATVKMDGQNGRLRDFKPKLKAGCGKKSKRGKR